MAYLRIKSYMLIILYLIILASNYKRKLIYNNNSSISSYNNNNNNDTSFFFNSLLTSPELSLFFVNGDQYYVSPNGNDMNDEGCSSSDNPCRTILYTTSIAKPQSTIILGPGLYVESNYSTIFQTSLNFIGVAGRDLTTITNSGKGIFYIDQSNVTFSGITFNKINASTPHRYTFLVERDLDILNYRTNLNLVQNAGPISLNHSILIVTDCSFTQGLLTTDQAMIFSTYSIINMKNVTFQINFSNLIFLYNTSFTGEHMQLISNRCNMLFTSIQSSIVLWESIIAYNRYSSGTISDSVVVYENVLAIKNFGILSFMFGPMDSKYRVHHGRFIDNHSDQSYTLFSLNAQQMTMVELSIFDGGSNLVGALIGSRSGALALRNCEFKNQKNVIFSLMGSSLSIIRSCSFHNFSANVFKSDSASILILVFSRFNNFNGKIIDFYSIGSAYVGSNFITNSNSQSPLFQLENGAYLFIFKSYLSNNTALSVFECGYGSSIDMFQSNISQSNSTSVLIGLEGYTIRVQDCAFTDNNMQIGGGIFFLDQTGNLTVGLTRFTRNRSAFGTVIFYIDPKFNDNEKQLKYFQVHHFLSNTTLNNATFLNNTATEAGALVYYSQNVFINFTCADCYMFGNRARRGNLVNSFYYSYTVSMATNVTTPIVLQIVIRAKDYFGQRFQGSEEIQYTASSTELDFRTSGITNVAMNPQGVTVMYNIQLSGIPGHNYTLFFKSYPTPLGGDVNETITFRLCDKHYHSHNVSGIFYCLKEKDISTIYKIIVTVLVVILGILALFCFGIVIVYWNHPIIRFSNQLFLCVVLFGCCVLLASLVTSYIVTSISCRLRSILLPMGLEIPVAAVVVKQYRLWKIRKVLSFQLKSVMGNRYFISYTAAFLLIPTIIVIIACTVNPLTPAIAYNTNDLTFSHVCKGERAYIYVIIFLIYALLFLVATCVLVFKTRPYRSSPGTFSEPTYLGILTYNYLIIILLLLPLRFSFPTKPNAQFLIVAVASFIFVGATILLLFVPKLIVLFKRKAVVSSLTKFIEEQQEELERNKDILQFYELYGNEEGNLNFANRNIFSPDSTSGTTISYRTSRSFSSQDIDRVLGNVHDPSPQNIRITSNVVKNRGMYSFTSSSRNDHSSSVSNLSTLSDFFDDDNDEDDIFMNFDDGDGSTPSSSSSPINLNNPNSMLPVVPKQKNNNNNDNNSNSSSSSSNNNNNNNNVRTTKKSKKLKRLKKKLNQNIILPDNNNNNNNNSISSDGNGNNHNNNNGWHPILSKSENNTPSNPSPNFDSYLQSKKKKNKKKN